MSTTSPLIKVIIRNGKNQTELKTALRPAALQGGPKPFPERGEKKARAAFNSKVLAKETDSEITLESLAAVTAQTLEDIRKSPDSASVEMRSLKAKLKLLRDARELAYSGDLSLAKRMIQAP